MKITDLLENVDILNTKQEDDDNVLRVGIFGIEDNDLIDNSILIDNLEDIFDEIEEEFIDDGDFDEISIITLPFKKGIYKEVLSLAKYRGYEIVGLVENDIDEVLYEDTDELIYFPDQDKEQYIIDNIDVFVKMGDSDMSYRILELAEQDDIPVFERDI